MAGGREIEDETRNQMMQNLFGDQSEDEEEDEEEEVDSEHDAAVQQPAYHSAEGQTIRANELLHRKWEKVNRKYVPPADRGQQLFPKFLEDALEEVPKQIAKETGRSNLRLSR
ncbi:hypothetical protein J5N97_015934 [Dioscorea zingiberensis]|uniref:Uncharacterized protein n=1 Tax=Dioscorea zingiberensis TaxID=325984 RepID=A0A9D5HEX7_9LILI|nr:hypothetical protein J5N97_015934 [Dioscorea zingiberensis]